MSASITAGLLGVVPPAARPVALSGQPGTDVEALAHSFGSDLLQHRRLFAQLDVLARPLEDAAVLAADLLFHGAQLLVIGSGQAVVVATLLVDELNHRASSWRPSRHRPARLLALTGAAPAAALVETRGHAGDVALWLASEGDSVSLLRAIDVARGKGMANLAIVGAGGGAVRHAADVCLPVHHDNPMRVQEAQLFLGHALLRQIDAALRT